VPNCDTIIYFPSAAEAPRQCQRSTRTTLVRRCHRCLGYYLANADHLTCSCSRKADNAGGKRACKRPLHRLPCCSSRGACSMRSFLSPPTHAHIYLCHYRMIFLYVTSPVEALYIERRAVGMALHTSWSCWHGIRRWPVSFPDSASSRIPLPAAFSNDAHSQWTV
jgi:hypothetical protein